VERLRQVSDGYLYDVIANGVRNMPPYAHQLAVRDRWAIVTYIRALQRSQNAQEEDLPESVLTRIQEGRTSSMEGQAGTSSD
jgi:mono/diheme cytochrome c family protein